MAHRHGITAAFWTSVWGAAFFVCTFWRSPYENFRIELCGIADRPWPHPAQSLLAQSKGLPAGASQVQVIRSDIEAETIANIAIRNLILERINDIADDLPFDTAVHGYFVVAEAGDTVETINAQVGFDVLSKPVEVLEDCGNCWDLLYIVDDSGYGVVLFIPKAPDITAELLAMCQRYAAKN